MQLLKTRWFWLAAPITTVVLLPLLAGDFVLAGIDWQSWGAAAIAAPVLAALIGTGLGWFSARRSPEELWLVAGVAAGSLFLLVVLQYLAAIILLPPCDTPQQVGGCFDDHTAAVGGTVALVGSAVVTACVGFGAIAGVTFRRWLTRTGRIADTSNRPT
jgi:hypothetical protein